VHVPFKGGAEAMNAVMAGDVQVAFASIAPALPLVQSGKLRLLAVTPARRSAAVPDTPTIAEAGVPGYDVSTWFGVAAPGATPKDVLQRLNAAIARAIASPEAREALLKQGLEPATGNVEQYTAFVQSELVKNAALAREIGLKAE
jgi:tripartite-type tricarboxylate transporter receptor subunit TctC